MNHIRRNEEGFALAHQMIDDVVAFPDADLDVTLQLIKKFFRIDLVKIVTRIRPLDYHNEKIAPIVQVTIADRRFEEIAVLLDPAEQIDRGLNRRFRLRVSLIQGFGCRADTEDYEVLLERSTRPRASSNREQKTSFCSRSSQREFSSTGNVCRLSFKIIDRAPFAMSDDRALLAPWHERLRMMPLFKLAPEQIANVQLIRDLTPPGLSRK